MVDEDDNLPVPHHSNLPVQHTPYASLPPATTTMLGQYLRAYFLKGVADRETATIHSLTARDAAFRERDKSSIENAVTIDDLRHLPETIEARRTQRRSLERMANAQAEAAALDAENDQTEQEIRREELSVRRDNSKSQEEQKQKLSTAKRTAEIARANQNSARAVAYEKQITSTIEAIAKAETAKEVYNLLQRAEAARRAFEETSMAADAFAEQRRKPKSDNKAEQHPADAVRAMILADLKQQQGTDSPTLSEADKALLHALTDIGMKFTDDDV